jgi:hypothetical protein
LTVVPKAFQTPPKKEINSAVKTYLRYLYGFKYCTRCGEWVKPEDIDYRSAPNNPNLQIARCPDCAITLRSGPKGEKSKKRIIEATGGVFKRY